MNRVLLLLAPLVCVGCQSADPLAVFGPYKVPPPTTSQASPYYPPTGATAQQPAEKTSPRLSVSVETPPPPISTTRVATEATDRQPIRIVENPSATTRTATATNRGGGTTGEPNFVPSSTATAK